MSDSTGRGEASLGTTPHAAIHAKQQAALVRSTGQAAPAQSKGEQPPRTARSAPAPGGVVRELDVLIRARYPLIYVVTLEEDRVERAVLSIAMRRGKQVYTWSCTQGLRRMGEESSNPTGNTSDPVQALDAVIKSNENAIYVFRDFHWYVEPARANVPIIRKLRDVSRHLRDSYKNVVLVGPCVDIAPDLDKDITVIHFPLPDEAELNHLLDRMIEDISQLPNVRIDLSPEDRERIVRSARGLTLREAENVFAKALVIDGCLDASDIDLIYSEKQQIVQKSGLLEYYESDDRMEHIGGLENLKQWLLKRSKAFSRKAQEYGLPPPRGVLLLGVQGCGKSLCARVIANMWRMPLIRLDVGRLFSSLVGSSEQNMREAIRIAETVAPCVLWLDEIDKAFAGALASAASDAGTGARVLGTFLTWLAEKKHPVFVVATANDVRKLPPELLRKGRLDEIFFVDLPNEQERAEIFAIHLRRRGRDPKNFDLAQLAALTEGFSGAEIEEAVISGLYDAFHEGVEITTEHIARAIRETVPLSKTMNEEITFLRNWAEGRARRASLPKTSLDELATRRKLEL